MDFPQAPMRDVDDLWIDLTLYLQSLTWLDWLDLLLAAAVFFVIVTALQRTQATFMLRGLMVIALILLAVTLLLPLPTFSLLVRIILLFLLIALPVVFQRDLRHLLEDIGRSIGLARGTRHEPEELMRPLVRAVEQMSADCIGALIVLEGEMDLEQIARTGIPIGGSVSSELLGAIFYPKNPLHDGAALIRGQKVIVAGCVLPVTRRDINGERRLGTRHRAAIGLSERSDALVIVVSEETGIISAAEFGQLHQLPDQSTLRERIIHFAHRTADVTESKSFVHALLNPDTGRLRSRFVRRVRSVGIRLALALLFATILWWFVLVRSNTLPDLEIRDVPLQVEERPPGMMIANQVPETVDLVVRTVEEVAPILDEGAFVARASLDGLQEGVYELPVQVTPRVDAPVRIVDIEPETVSINLAPVAGRTLSVTVALEDESLLPPVYQIQGEPVAEPAMVEIVGPQPAVEQVAEIRATLSLSNTRGSIEIMRPLIALDEQGNEIDGLDLQPAQVKVRLNVDRRPDVREVGVAIVTNGEPAPGFWISGLTAQPATVVLTGPPAILSSVRSAVATLPVDVSGAAGDVNTVVPLDLPQEVEAQTAEGKSLRAVQVTVRISARQGNITLSRRVELRGSNVASGLAVTPEVVELLLSGPLTTLQEIEDRPDLVRVIVEVEDIAPGESIELTPQVVAPEGVRAQLVPLTVTLSRR
ncbi:MAG TPA: diadenylate cyclase CdaA [Anaerolineae bacterium]